MPTAFLLLDIAGVLFAVWLLKAILSRRKPGPLPPGPKPLPIIGNLLDMPSYKPWETFAMWGQLYGDIVHLNMLGQPLIIVNSQKVAVELLEKRSSLYSDRAFLESSHSIGYDRTLPLTPYGSRLREQRRMLSQTLGTRSLVEKYGPLEEHQTHDLLLRILRDPDNFFHHIERFSGAIILLISYGYQVKRDGEDSILTDSFEAVEQFAEAVLPGAFLVDTIPALRFVPSWFPGAGWKKKAATFRSCLIAIMDKLLAFTKQEMHNGKAISSFVSRNLERNISSPDLEDVVKWTGVALVGGGADTSSTTIHAFFLAMTLYPEVQRKAQAEIDAVVGKDRLPTFQDRDHLPYVNAICMELLRWLPVGPLGVPHRLIEDDAYNEYVFPKGSVFIVNLWGLLHDPERYPNPTEFVPERYLKNAENTPQEDPHNIVFGYGRRVCPGVHVADATVFIAVSNLLAVFNVSKRVENGVPITPVVAQTSASISHPLPFKCSIKPRSANAEHLILSANEYRDPEALPL